MEFSVDKIYSRKRLLIPNIRKKRDKSGKKGAFSGAQINENIGILNSKKKLINNYDPNNKKINIEKVMNRKLIKTSLIIIIAICIANRIISSIEPTIDILSKDMAKSIATKISNEQATVVMRKLSI